MTDFDPTKFSVNFDDLNSATVPYTGPTAPKAPTTFRALAKNGIYKVELSSPDAKQSKANNIFIELVATTLDTDEIGAKVNGRVMCSGFYEFKNRDGVVEKHAMLEQLCNLLISTGTPVTKVESMRAGKISTPITTIMSDYIDGKIAYCVIQHELQTEGKNVGKERATISRFVSQADYEQAIAKGTARWEKRLDKGPAAVSNGAQTLDTATADAMAAMI